MCWYCELSGDEAYEQAEDLLIAWGEDCSRVEAENFLGQKIDETGWALIKEQMQEAAENRHELLGDDEGEEDDEENDDDEEFSDGYEEDDEEV